MRVVLNQKHLSLNKRLAKEVNKLAKRFNNKAYSKIENIENTLLRRDISVEKKKGILAKKLHEHIVRAFSINKNKFNKKSFDLLKKRLHNIRRIIIKLRSINYYLETTFLEDLKLSKIKISDKDSRLSGQNALARDELEVLEYTTYKLIGEVIMLDKKLLKEYSHKGEIIEKKEKIEAKGIGLTLRKESELLEHLEAKLPPPKAASIALLKEPLFTHWAARIFALLSSIEHMCIKEKMIFSKLKKNKAVKMKINKKITHLMQEKSKLVNIMQEKATAMAKFRLDNNLKKELHNLTTAISL